MRQFGPFGSYRKWPFSWELSGGRPREAIQDFYHTWPARFRELLGLRGWAPWEEGYGAHGPDTIGYVFEGLVRCAELLGVGLFLTLLDDFMYGPRTKPAAPYLSTAGAAFAKTRIAGHVLAKALLDAQSGTAKRMKIAFAFGRVVKTGSVPHEALLTHELVHVAQYFRWGWAYVAKALWSQHRGAGYAYAIGTPVEQLNAEQEASYYEDERRLALGLARRHGQAPPQRLPY